MNEIENRPAQPSDEAPVAERSFLSALVSDVNQVVTGVAIGVGSAVTTARILNGRDKPPSDGAGGGTSEPAPGDD
jgi:hypothetical protein